MQLRSQINTFATKPPFAARLWISGPLHAEIYTRIGKHKENIPSSAVSNKRNIQDAPVSIPINNIIEPPCNLHSQGESSVLP